MIKKLLYLSLVLPFLISCSDAGDKRSFYYFLNEEYRMTECADMGAEMPNSHPYFSQFNKDKVYYTQYFDTTKSLLELRVEVDNMNKPHGYGFIKLYKKNGLEVINLDVKSYIGIKHDYQWGSFKYDELSKDEKIYFLSKECVRFRYSVYIEEEDKEVLITFGYNLGKTYEYPEQFKDLSWLV